MLSVGRTRRRALGGLVHSHHTKDKGDLAVAKAHADLVGTGCVVLFPTTEHAPFDLVAYRDGAFSRVLLRPPERLRGICHPPRHSRGQRPEGRRRRSRAIPDDPTGVVGSRA
ncbi:group I intron-associated PD-(D/E)XK endonuclease [Nocardioides ultimimeridianus]